MLYSIYSYTLIKFIDPFHVRVAVAGEAAERPLLSA